MPINDAHEFLDQISGTGFRVIDACLRECMVHAPPSLSMLIWDLHVKDTSPHHIIIRRRLAELALLAVY